MMAKRDSEETVHLREERVVELLDDLDRSPCGFELVAVAVALTACPVRQAPDVVVKALLAFEFDRHVREKSGREQAQPAEGLFAGLAWRGLQTEHVVAKLSSHMIEH